MLTGILRNIHVPTCIQENFLNIARHNTSRNIETCGILSGKLVCCKLIFFFFCQGNKKLIHILEEQ